MSAHLYLQEHTGYLMHSTEHDNHYGLVIFKDQIKKQGISKLSMKMIGRKEKQNGITFGIAPYAI